VVSGSRLSTTIAAFSPGQALVAATPLVLLRARRIHGICSLRVGGPIILPVEPPRVYVMLLLLLALVPHNEADGQVRPDPLTKSFEGCYDLTMGRWWPWSFGEENQFVTPPGRVRLFSERGTSGFEHDRLLLRSLPSRKGTASGRGGPAYWDLKSESEIELVWTDGFTAVRLSLRGSGNVFRGWAHPHFDYFKLIPRIAHVTARKNPCDALP